MSTATRPIAGRASRTKPCPVCTAGTKNCSWTDDGLHLCRGEPADPSPWKRLTKAPDAAGFHHFRRAEDHHERNGHHKPLKDKPPINWQTEAEKYAKRLTPEACSELAKLLGLPVDSLAAFPLLGWIPDHRVNQAAPGEPENWTSAPCWTFPEVNAAGRILGITRRFREPVSIAGGNPTTKAIIFGGSHGLYIPAGWRNRPGPVFIPEGGSDVLALSAAGLSALGRFSNTGGGELLAEALRILPADRSIVVLAEHDQKPDGKWPGKEGAEKVAQVLKERLKRPVRIVFAPGETKDARAWVHELAAGFAESEDYPAIGRAILEYCEREAKKGLRFHFIDTSEFLITDYRRDYLIQKFLTNEPGVIAGPSKGMKTSLIVDMGISLAAGVPFLGEFCVPRPIRAAIASGESGAATLQETTRRIIKAKGIDPDVLTGKLQWCFTLPEFADLSQVAEIADTLKALESQFVFIDPVYLCVDGDIEHGNAIKMGQMYCRVAEILAKAGVQVMLSHHATKQLKVGMRMGLEHLLYSGLEQFSRQWVFMNRASPYEHDGNHDLLVSAGGSAGFGGAWDVRIEEGLADEHFQGRFWDVKVTTPDQAKAEKFDKREAARIETGRRKMATEQAAVLDAIDAECSTHEAATKTRIKDRTAFGTPKLGETLAALVEAGAIEEHEFKKKTGQGAKTPVRGFRRVKTER